MTLSGLTTLPRRLAHLLAVFAENHSLVDQFFERLFGADITNIEKEFVPEARIKQMQHRVLRPADVKVNRHPVFFLRRVAAAIIIVRVDIPQIIPAASRPLRHRVCLAQGNPAALRAGRLEPVRRLRQRRLARRRRRVILHIRQLQRQFRFRYRHYPAFVAMHKRNRLAPVSLPAEKPVAQFIIDRLFAKPFFLKPVCDSLFEFGRLQARELAASLSPCRRR